MAISLFVYIVSFSGKFYFWGNYFFTLPQSNYFDEAGVTSEVLLFLRSFLFLEQSPLRSSQIFRIATFSEENFYQAATS